MNIAAECTAAPRLLPAECNAAPRLSADGATALIYHAGDDGSSVRWRHDSDEVSLSDRLSRAFLSLHARWHGPPPRDYEHFRRFRSATVADGPVSVDAARCRR